MRRDPRDQMRSVDRDNERRIIDREFERREDPRDQRDERIKDSQRVESRQEERRTIAENHKTHADTQPLHLLLNDCLEFYFYMNFERFQDPRNSQFDYADFLNFISINLPRHISE
jgi:hypothetical protein